MQGDAVCYTLHKAAHYGIKVVGHKPAQRVFGTPRGSRWSRGLGRAEDFYGSRCGCTVVCFDAIDLKKLRNPALKEFFSFAALFERS